MAEQTYSRARGEVLQPTDARQASPRKANFRVLIVSMALAAVVGFALVAGYWKTTPTAMDYSAGGKLGEQQATPQAPQEAKPATAPEAAPSTATPSAPSPSSTP